ncbi:hypothetical protein ACPB9E_37145, partial [Streptomyces exfoliatus]
VGAAALDGQEADQGGGEHSQAGDDEGGAPTPDLVNDYARRQGQLTADDEDITTGAVHEGLTAVISIKLAHPVFEGSTRSRLSNPEAGAYVQEVVRQHLTD